MELQINRWGNSLALRLPAALVRDLGVHEGVSISPQELGERLLSLGKPPATGDRKKWVRQIVKLHADMPVTQPLTAEEMSRY